MSDLHDQCQLYALEIRTSQWETMVEWYRNALGLRSLVRVVDDGFALMITGGTRVILLARDTPGEPNTRITLALETDNLAAAATRLEDAGAVASEPRVNAEGLNELTTTDPDGNRIRIFTWPKRE